MIDDGGAEMARQWVVGVVAVLATVPLVLGGCSSAPQASKTLPSPSTSSASSTLPPLGPADFPVPAEARQKTPGGVLAFTKYYIQLMNRQLNVLDSTPLRNLSRDCQTCSELADSYDQARTAGQRFDGGIITISGTGSAVVSGDTGETSFVLDQQATVLKDATGTEVHGRYRPATKFTGGVRLIWDTAQYGWLVTQFDAEPL